MLKTIHVLNFVDDIELRCEMVASLSNPKL